MQQHLFVHKVHLSHSGFVVLGGCAKVASLKVLKLATSRGEERLPKKVLLCVTLVVFPNPQSPVYAKSCNTKCAFVMTRICDSFFFNAMATCLFGSVSSYVAFFFGSPIFLVVQYRCFFQCQMLSFPEVPKEKRTLILPVEEIVIIREPPKYVPPTQKLPFDDPTRPALVF